MQNEARRSQPLPTDTVSDQAEPDLTELLDFLFNARKLIAIVTTVVTALALLYALLATPIYSSDVLIQIEEKASGGLGEFSSMLSEKSPTEAEIEILKSRAVIGSAIDELHLDIAVIPRYFPLIGKAIARHHGASTPAAPLLGMESYDWGGSQLQIDRLDVREELQGQQLLLVAGESGAYTLHGPDGEQLLSGIAGKASVANGNGLFVSRLVANAGMRFTVIKHNRLAVIDGLKRSLTFSEQGRKTGIIRLSMEHRDPRLLQSILSAIANGYLRQNVERRSQEAEQTLKFLDTQLPELKGSLDTAETQLAQYRSTVGSVDLTMEAQGLLNQYADLEKRISELELKRTELSEKFTTSHPAIVALNEQIGRLRATLSTLDNQIRQLPEQEQKSVRLSRDVKVSNELYLLLLNKAQEMRVVKAGTTGNVRIIDQAYTPTKPVKPKRLMILIIGLLLGLLSGIFAAFLRRALNKGVTDPELLEQRLGITSFASIMHSDLQAKSSRRRAKQEDTRQLLAFSDPADLAIEAMRSLRTSLQFASLEAANNIIAISGPSPGIGKSFISANLAAVLADSGKRVLLIDGDMRKGHLHEAFGLPRKEGLSNVISGELNFEEAVSAISDNLHFLQRGIAPPNPAELLMSAQFSTLIHRVAKEFDHVIIDTPPVLAVTDPSIIGRLSGINFVVLRSGQHPLREIEQAVRRLQQNGITVNGFVFNDVPLKSSGYGAHYSYHYHYSYK